MSLRKGRNVSNVFNKMLTDQTSLAVSQQNSLERPQTVPTGQGGISLGMRAQRSNKIAN